MYRRRVPRQNDQRTSVAVLGGGRRVDVGGGDGIPAIAPTACPRLCCCNISAKHNIISKLAGKQLNCSVASWNTYSFPSPEGASNRKVLTLTYNEHNKRRHFIDVRVINITKGMWQSHGAKINWATYLHSKRVLFLSTYTVRRQSNDDTPFLV